MLFPTATFAIFFLLVLPLSWLTMPWPHRWRPFIVVASYVFYSWWDWRFVFLLAGCTLWNQVLAVRIWRTRAPSQRKALLFLALAGNLAVLGYFKYYDFFVTSTDNLLSVVGLDVPLGLKSIVLPVGISFYTFMAISYVVDAYRGDFEPTTLEKFAVYLSFFPHLVAGPIVRPSELIPQFDTPRNPRRVDTSRAFYLIATGLFKKVVIANYLASSIVDEVFAAPGQHSSLEILIAVYAYAVQIYADFSGYTDIAIGIALLLGFTFPQNFDSPYAAVSRAGLLAALAHDALALAARLRLHPARRQPRQAHDPHVPEPAADDADRRALARRRVDVRRVGRAPRRGPRRRSGCWRERRGPSTRRGHDLDAVARPDPHVPLRLPRVDLLPRRLVRRRVGHARGPRDRLGRVVAARHERRAARDRRRHRVAVPPGADPAPRDGPLLAAAGARARRPCSRSRSCSRACWARRAWHPSSTSSSDAGRPPATAPAAPPLPDDETRTLERRSQPPACRAATSLRARRPGARRAAPHGSGAPATP